MAGSSFFKHVRKTGILLTAIITSLAIAGCGEGDGPTGIANVAVPPLDLPPGFCDPINFEIECDQPAIIWFGGGQTVVIDNPDKSGINQSDRVARMQKFFDQPFGGTRLNPVEVPVDFAAGRAFTMKVWSEREVPVTFKLEETNDGSGGRDTVATHSGGSVWEELCFDFTSIGVPGNPTIGLTIIFDNFIQGGAIGGVFEGDWTFYYDDITQVESCSVNPPTGVVPDVSLYDPDATPEIPDDVVVTGFDSLSVINDMYADDTTYSKVLAVSSGVGYGANVAQIGFTGSDRGFLSEFASLDFKVKGMPNSVIFVKLFDSVDSLRLNLTSSAYAEGLTDGWYQVSIPISDFNGASLATGIVLESDNTAPMQFNMLLNDVGFSEVDDGGGNNGGGGFDDGLLTNGDFEAGASPWLLGTANPIGAENVIEEDGSQVFFVNVQAAGESFDVNLSQKLAITPGETYTLSFKAKSNVTRSMLAGIGQSGGDFFSATQSINLTTDWQTFSIEVTATDDNGGGNFGESDSRVLFDMGAEIGQVFIDDVSLVVAGDGNNGGGGFDDGLLTNGDFEAGVSPWLLGTTNPIGAENVIEEDGNQVFFVNVQAAGETFDVNLSQKLAITPGETYTLSFKAKSNVTRSMLAGIGQSGGSFFSATQSVSLTTDWQTFSIEVTATDDNGGGDFGESDSRVLFDMGAEIGQVFIDDVSLVVTGGGTGGGSVEGDIAINGGFESGQFNDGSENASWQQFPGAGSQTIVTTNPSEGTYAANLSVPIRGPGDLAVDNLIKNANLGAGSLTPNAPVTVTWDMRGELEGAGGVVFAELFSELSGGGTSKAEIYTGDPISPDSDPDVWTSYTWNTTLGSDVGGGVTLQLKVGCGPVEGCGADIFFDNVTIVVD